MSLRNLATQNAKSGEGTHAQGSLSARYQCCGATNVKLLIQDPLIILKPFPALGILDILLGVTEVKLSMQLIH